jgi:hypothetical protein
MSGGRAVRIRSVSSTALIYCEGAHDLAFLRYLISTYSKSRTINTKFRGKQGKGGSPDTLVIEAINIPGDFDRKLVKADRDRAEEEIQRADELAGQNDIVIVWSRPCIEALLLTILDGRDRSLWKPQTCKRTFERLHVPASRRTDAQAYARVYTPEILEDARQRLPELDQLISFITHNAGS